MHPEITNRTISISHSENDGTAETCSDDIPKPRTRFDQIEIIPTERFNVLAYSEWMCNIQVSSSKPGPIEDVIYLTVNDGELRLQLPIKAEVMEREFSVTPSRLDFQIVKTGTRCKKKYVITNESPQEIFWNVKEYNFNFREGKLEESEELQDEKHIKSDEGVLCHKGSFYTETYELQGRVRVVQKLTEIEN